MIKPDLNDLKAKDARTKYACAKNVLALAENEPEKLYGDLSIFVKLLDDEKQILRWTAIDVIGWLARVDQAGEIDRLLDRIMALLNGGNLITANHAISALTNIALAKPEHLGIITGELLKVEHYDYETNECRNIALGKVVLALDKLIAELPEKEAPLALVKRQTANPRPATRKKAEQFLKKHHRQN
jgi:hypothetical protein